MTTCREVIDQLFEYVEGGLCPEAAQLVRTHFANCAHCDDFLESYLRTVSLCPSALTAKMPEEAARRLSEVLREARSSGKASDSHAP
jgi:anti-sigma factor RsiW